MGVDTATAAAAPTISTIANEINRYCHIKIVLQFDVCVYVCIGEFKGIGKPYPEHKRDKVNERSKVMSFTPWSRTPRMRTNHILLINILLLFLFNASVNFHMNIKKNAEDFTILLSHTGMTWMSVNVLFMKWLYASVGLIYSVRSTVIQCPCEDMYCVVLSKCESRFVKFRYRHNTQQIIYLFILGGVFDVLFTSRLRLESIWKMVDDRWNSSNVNWIETFVVAFRNYPHKPPSQHSITTSTKRQRQFATFGNTTPLHVVQCTCIYGV